MTDINPNHLRRIPNLLHLMVLLAITFFALFLCEAVLMLMHPHDILATLQNQKLQLIANMVDYGIALAAAYFVFPLLWHRTLNDGISWSGGRVKLWLVPLGIVLGLIVEAGSTLLPTPKSMPIEQVFATPGIIWTLAIFGTLVAPVFEEIVFRGFMLPALALNYDYLTLPKSLDALDAWRASDTMSRNGLLISSAVTSLFFAGIHAPQLGLAWGAVGLLFAVSLVLCYVRIRLKSVAASTLVHVSYNAAVFITLFFQTGGFKHMDKL